MPKEPDNHLIRADQPRGFVGPALAAIPYLGGPLSSAWSNWHNDRRFERAKEMMGHLDKRIGLLEDKSPLESLGDDDMQLLESALQTVQFARTEERRKAFANLMVSCWTDKRSRQFDERTVFVEALADFNEHHIVTLRIINQAGFEGAARYADLRDSVLSSVDSDERDSIMVPVLDTLASQFGFIKRAWGLNEPGEKGALMFTGNLSAEGIARKCNHAVTPLGQRFVESIGEPTTNPRTA